MASKKSTERMLQSFNSENVYDYTKEDEAIIAELSLEIYKYEYILFEYNCKFQI